MKRKTFFSANSPFALSDFAKQNCNEGYIKKEKIFGFLRYIFGHTSKNTQDERGGKFFFAITIISLFFGCNLLASGQNEQPKKDQFEETVYNWSRTFAEVLQLTDKKHYKISNPEKCMVKAIENFMVTLDPHSTFLDPKTYKNILESTSSEFFGIGIVIDNTRQPKEKFLLVVDTIPGGPADTAGVKPLDKIIEIEGKLLDGMSTEQATAMLKGERHTKVTIKVLRESSPDLQSFEITRDVIKEQNSLCFYLPDQNMYYLSLNMFTENSVKQIKELLQKSRSKKYKALILDLRNNSGGLLTAAIDIASLFLDTGTLVVTTKNKNNKETDRYVTKEKPVANDTLPIFVLINNYTASAAEILAGCLKLHSQEFSKKAKGTQQKLMVFLVGSKTFGKGSVQEVIPVGNNCAVKLTTSLYFLPHDTSIQGIGIEPDFVIEKRFPPTSQITWFTKFYGREQALENYINVHGKTDEESKEATKPEKEKNWTERAQQALSEDNQFREVITLANLLHMAQTSCPANVGTREKAVQFIKSIYVTTDTIKMTEVTI